MELWYQITVSAGTVITLLLGFWVINNNLNKAIDKKIKAQRKIDQAERDTDKKTQEATCKDQCGTMDDMKKDFEDYMAKQKRVATMQFKCQFTTLEALDKIAHNQPINGEVKDRLIALKEFTIKESLD